MENEFAVVKHENGQQHALVQAEMAKQIQEIQASLVIAKNFPRDENAAFNKIMTACKRKKLAEDAMYVYPRGGQTVTGPSIRLAEAVAQCWGNIDYGIRELSQSDGNSEVEAYCWDMETNTRSRKIFQVKHERHTKKGKYALTDPRDIYEMTANQGARRLRACILAVIPGDVIDAAVSQCEKTLAGASDEPLKDRIRKMVAGFSEIGVSKEMLEQRLGHKIDVTSNAELVELRKIYKSLTDNMASREQFFDVKNAEPATAEDLEAKLQNGNGKASPASKADIVKLRKYENSPLEDNLDGQMADEWNDIKNTKNDDLTTEVVGQWLDIFATMEK